MNVVELLRWDEIPEVMNKDQFASFCHVNEVQATALLDGGEIPYEANEDEKAYRIRKRDALDYLTSHPLFPAICHAPEDWYREEYRVAFPTEYLHRTQAKLKAYFTDLLAGGLDVYATQDVIDLTGYSRRAVNQWCRSGELRHFVVRNGFYTPKSCLAEFFCSKPFWTIQRKSDWHNRVMFDFHMRYARRDMVIRRVSGAGKEAV